MKKLFVCLCLVSALAGTAFAAGSGYYQPTWLGSALCIPECVNIIEEEAFAGDTSLTQLVIGENVERLDAGALAGCTGIMRIAILSRTLELGENSLGTPDEPKEIWAPGGSTAQAYAAAYGYTFVRIPFDATDLLEYAATKLGTKYVRGSWDCVFYVYYCYLDVFGIRLPDTCPAMQNMGTSSVLARQGISATRIDRIEDLMPGDIICWKDDNSSVCSHVGMYVGSGYFEGEYHSSGIFIENSNSKGCVRYNYMPPMPAKITQGMYINYYTRNFICAWRIL